MKKRTLEGFGKRLAQIRVGQGMTQVELGKAVNVFNRVIAYDEHDNAQPPGVMLIDLARALQVTTDELPGVKPLPEPPGPKTARLLNRLRRVEQLPTADQKAVLKFVEALLETRGARNPQRPTASSWR